MEKYMKLSDLLTYRDIQDINFTELKNKFKVRLSIIEPQSLPSEILQLIQEYSLHKKCVYV